MDIERKSPPAAQLGVVAPDPEPAGFRPLRFTRRDFLVNSAALPPLIAALFAAPVLVSCADSSSSSKDSSSGDGDDAGAGNVEGAISANHGHDVEITAAQLKAGAAVTLTLTTGNSHTHTLDLTAAQVTDIADSVKVTGTSSTDSGHSHGVTFN
jgi:hypothetical protein